MKWEKYFPKAFFPNNSCLEKKGGEGACRLIREDFITLEANWKLLEISEDFKLDLEKQRSQATIENLPGARCVLVHTQSPLD